MNGFWGEGHTNDLPETTSEDLTAGKSCAQVTQLQIMARKRTPLIMNAEPGINNVGESPSAGFGGSRRFAARSEHSLTINE